MDGDVCSCLPLQLAELVPRLCAFALGSLPTMYSAQVRHAIRCKLEGWMFPGEKLTDVILWIIIDRSNDNGNGSRYRHADRQMSGPDIVSQYFQAYDRVTR